MSAYDPEASPEAARAKHESNKILQEGLDHLTHAKDRAQMSAASAMSILDVGVLADVIKRGSANSMYIPLLVMVSLAMLLQIVVGGLSIKVSDMKTYYNTFGRNRRRTFGCLDSEGRSRPPDENGITRSRAFFGRPHVFMAIPDYELEEEEPREPVEQVEHEHWKEKEEEQQQQQPPIARVSLCQTTTIPYAPNTGTDKQSDKVSSLEDKSLAIRLRTLMEQMIKRQEQGIETKAKIQFLEKQIALCKSKLDDLNHGQEELNKAEAALKQEMTDASTARHALKPEPKELTERTLNVDAEFAEQKFKVVENRMRIHFEKNENITDGIRQVETEMRARKQERDQLMKKGKRLEIDQEKFKMYSMIVRDIEKITVLKRVMFWQNMINYILYGVFILNIFITAFSFVSCV